MQLTKQSSTKLSAQTGSALFGFSILVATAAVLLLLSCTSSSTVVMHAEDGSILGRLRQLSEFPPLYELRYEAPYNVVGPVTSVPPAASVQAERLFACTCFSAIDASGSRVMGRNFDWLAHPILVLITRPAGGYASISVVDMSYIWSLADAPRWPFDGMNERGLAAGMMLVEEARSACELGMPSVSSFGIIRVILDEAATVDEAVALMDKYFVSFGDRPLHYFLADRTGASAVVEYYRGELRVFRAEGPWQVAVELSLLRDIRGQTAPRVLAVRGGGRSAVGD
jgi:hypothetical protein